ncbi:MAG: acyl carrier protein [Candidatus Omnitrophota bacterium]
MAGLFFKRRKAKPVDEDVFIKVRSILAKQANIHEDKITLETRLIDDMNIDSLQSIKLVIELEEVFDIEIPDEDAEKALTVRDIDSYITAKLKEQK